MISYPFDSQIVDYEADGSPIYDRAADSAVLAEMLHRFFRDGIVPDDDGVTGWQVLQGNGMSVTVDPGYVIITGRCGYEQTIQTLSIPVANSSNPRIDAVVLRRDLDVDVRNISLQVVSGTPAASPIAPTPTRNGSIWELHLAHINVPANATQISQANITDVRLNTNLCGISQVPLKVFDTEQFYAQVQADLAQFKAEEQAEFERWVENIQGLFEGDVAANLASAVSIIKEQLSTGTVNDSNRLGGFTLDELFPVGTILMFNSLDIEPAQIYGGWWVRIYSRFIVASGNAYPMGSTGGSSTVTLKRNNIPPLSLSTITSSGSENGYAVTITNGNYQHNVSGKVNGDITAQPFSILPPYKAVAVWERVASATDKGEEDITDGTEYVPE